MQATSQLKDLSFTVAFENSWVLGSWWLWAKAVQFSQLFFKWMELKLLKGSETTNTLGVLALVGILGAYTVLFWILNRKVGENLIHFYKAIVCLCVAWGHCHIPSCFTICCKHSWTLAMALFSLSTFCFKGKICQEPPINCLVNVTLATFFEVIFQGRILKAKQF